MLDNIELSYRKTKQFTQDASHELRIPLTVILGNIELIETFPDDADIMSEGIRAIKSEAENMKRMTERLLTIARMEQSQFSPSVEPIPVKSFLSSVGEEISKVCGRVIDIKAADLTLHSDPSLLTQLLRVLPENAIKYSEREVLMIAEPYAAKTHTAKKLSEPPHHIRIKIIDFGIGIPSEELEKVSDRFYRTDQSRNSLTGGTGLGLSIADSIVDVLGGTLKLESELGKGTTAIVALPLSPK